MNLLRPRLLGKVNNLLKNYIFCNEILSILQNYQCHLRIKSEPLFKKHAFMLFFIICHSRLSGILLQNEMMRREDKKDSGQARMTKCIKVV